jgi:hypothetical protein
MLSGPHQWQGRNVQHLPAPEGVRKDSRYNVPTYSALPTVLPSLSPQEPHSEQDRPISDCYLPIRSSIFASCTAWPPPMI